MNGVCGGRGGGLVLYLSNLYNEGEGTKESGDERGRRIGKNG